MGNLATHIRIRAISPSGADDGQLETLCNLTDKVGIVIAADTGQSGDASRFVFIDDENVNVIEKSLYLGGSGGGIENHATAPPLCCVRGVPPNGFTCLELEKKKIAGCHRGQTSVDVGLAEAIVGARRDNDEVLTLRIHGDDCEAGGLRRHPDVGGVYAGLVQCL
jgi:hypothetical protein